MQVKLALIACAALSVSSSERIAAAGTLPVKSSLCESLAPCPQLAAHHRHDSSLRHRKLSPSPTDAGYYRRGFGGYR